MRNQMGQQREEKGEEGIEIFRMELRLSPTEMNEDKVSVRTCRVWTRKKRKKGKARSLDFACCLAGTAT